MTNRLAKEIAAMLHNHGIGVYGTADPDARTIYTGQMPYDVAEGIFIIEVPSPPPHQYVDTEYPVLDFWSKSPYTDAAHEKLERVFNLLHRRYHYDTANWHIAFSQALGNIIDVDTNQEGSKLYRLSVQFICRNLNNVS